MKVTLKKSMNCLMKNGKTAPANAGAVIDVNDRFGNRIVAAGRAEKSVSPAKKAEKAGAQK
ncbi:hypothetical protein [Prosthecochloris sp.]|uniref:hypothetical protein n=1 Tax=Prosthecochloris sp. TaxID=290513 RepID=UPI0025D5E136|nr:hypothetical protein [Prosthecochloris sp.]